MKRITIEVPEELISLVGSDEEAQTEAKEALVFNLVRRGKISKGKAAELLGVVVWELPTLLAKYQILWFTYGLKVGCLGILREAKLRGIIQEVKSPLDALRGTGLGRPSRSLPPSRRGPDSGSWMPRRNGTRYVWTMAGKGGSPTG